MLKLNNNAVVESRIQNISSYDINEIFEKISEYKKEKGTDLYKHYFICYDTPTALFHLRNTNVKTK